MLFLTKVKFFLSAISFKALIVVNSFRNHESLGTKPKLRTWVRDLSQESVSSLSAVGRLEIGHFITDRGRPINKLEFFRMGNFISSTASTVQCHTMPIHFTR